MQLDPDFLALLYEAAGDPRAWAPFYRALHARLGAAATGLTFREPDGVRQTWEGLDPEFERSYTEHYFRTDPWVTGALAKRVLVPGRVVTSHELVDADDLRRNACFQELCRPHGLTDLVGVFLEGPGERVVNTTIFLRPDGPVGQEEAARFLADMTPHIARVVRLQQRLEVIPLWEQATTDAMERLTVAAVVLDVRGRALRWNRAAEPILQGPHHLKVRGGARLSLGSPRQDAELHGMLLARMPWTSVVPHPGGRHLALTLVPLAGRAEDHLPAAMLYVLDLSSSGKSTRQLLQTGFRLTPAESRLAELIAQGMAPREAASRIGVSVETVRTQLKSVMSKLGIRRQSQLVRLVSGLRPLA